MSKVSFTKLGLTKNTGIASFDWNGQTVEVKQYLPIQEKLDLISSVVNNCQDENSFINEGKMSMFMNLEIVYRYTNINFTKKQKSDPTKLYDLLAGSGFFDDIFEVLPQTEYRCIITWLSNTVKSFYEYRNSVYGILDAIKTDYSKTNLNITELLSSLEGSEDIGLIKEILPLLNS